MKSKREHVPGARLLKWHAIFFVIFTILLWLSVIATFSYPGNADGPFEVFKPFLVERMAVNILWGIALLAHFGAQELRTFLRQRAYDAHLNSLYLSDDFYDDQNSDSIPSRLEEEDAQKLKRSR